MGFRDLFIFYVGGRGGFLWSLGNNTFELENFLKTPNILRSHPTGKSDSNNNNSHTWKETSKKKKKMLRNRQAVSKFTSLHFYESSSISVKYYDGCTKGRRYVSFYMKYLTQAIENSRSYQPWYAASLAKRKWRETEPETEVGTETERKQDLATLHFIAIQCRDIWNPTKET